MKTDRELLPIDQKTEGWTWHLGGRKWHYYRNKRALCGGVLMLIHPSEGYEQGNDSSPENCTACKRKKAAEVYAAAAIGEQA